jgi:hypothetical protein
MRTTAAPRAKGKEEPAEDRGRPAATGPRVTILGRAWLTFPAGAVVETGPVSGGPPVGECLARVPARVVVVELRTVPARVEVGTVVEETAVGSDADVVGDAVDTGIGAVGDGLVATVDVVVVAGATGEMLVARTADGAKGGCPVVPEMLVAPYTQASTLPGGGR